MADTSEEIKEPDETEDAADVEKTSDAAFLKIESTKSEKEIEDILTTTPGKLSAEALCSNRSDERKKTIQNERVDTQVEDEGDSELTEDLSSSTGDIPRMSDMHGDNHLSERFDDEPEPPSLAKKMKDRDRLQERRKISSTFFDQSTRYEGYCMKKGYYSGTWKKRYLVLLKSQDIHYFADKRQIDELGCLALSKHTKFNPIGLVEMEMVSHDRTWNMKFPSAGERDEWIIQLTQCAENEGSKGELVATDYLCKLGSPIPRWKTKYVKFYQNSVMKFFDHEGNSMISGITILKGTKVEVVRRKNATELDWPFEFHVHTPNRLWKFRTRSVMQQNKWVQKLTRMFQSAQRVSALPDGRFEIEENVEAKSAELQEV